MNMKAIEQKANDWSNDVGQRMYNRGETTKDIAVAAFKAAAMMYDGQATRHAVEACKRMCPSRSARGCMNSIHRQETKSTLCDGICQRIKYFLNDMERQAL